MLELKQGTQLADRYTLVRRLGGDSETHTWLAKDRLTRASVAVRRDPYQKVFNDFANDLQQHVALLAPKQLQRTRQISELKFFSDMSPTAYSGHLATDKKGISSVVRLPAENDPSTVTAV